MKILNTNKKINFWQLGGEKMYKTIVIEYSPKADDMAREFDS